MIIKYKKKMILAFVINVICTACIVSVFFLLLLINYDDTYVYGFVKAPISKKMFLISFVIEMWGSVSPFIPLYFHILCLILNLVINTVWNNLFGMTFLID